jgi:hypothetical protein
MEGAMDRMLADVEESGKQTAAIRFGRMKADYAAAREWHLDRFNSYFDHRGMTREQIVRELERLQDILPVGNPFHNALRENVAVALTVEREALEGAA